MTNGIWRSGCVDLSRKMDSVSILVVAYTFRPHRYLQFTKKEVGPGQGEVYPVHSGSKTEGASKSVARMIDRDPEKKLAAYTESTVAVLMAANGLTTDEITSQLGMDAFYLRPRLTELDELGAITMTPKQRLSARSRPMQVRGPSNDLMERIVRERPDDLQQLRMLVRAFVLTRIEAKRAAQAPYRKRHRKHSPQ